MKSVRKVLCFCVKQIKAPTKELSAIKLLKIDVEQNVPAGCDFFSAFHAASSEKSLNMSPLCEASSLVKDSAKILIVYDKHPHISSLNRQRLGSVIETTSLYFTDFRIDNFGISLDSRHFTKGRRKWRHLSTWSRILRHDTRNSMKLRS